MNKLKFIGATVSIIGFVLLGYIYDWRLSVIMIFIILGNNLEQKCK